MGNYVVAIPKGEFVPDSKEDLDLHLTLNSKMDIEVATEESIDFEFMQNDFDQLRSKLAKDFVDINRTGVKMYFDENKKVRIK